MSTLFCTEINSFQIYVIIPILILINFIKKVIKTVSLTTFNGCCSTAVVQFQAEHES